MQRSPPGCGPAAENGQKLPCSKTQNVGFGFTDVTVTDAELGTACRIYVDERLKDESEQRLADVIASAGHGAHKSVRLRCG